MRVIQLLRAGALGAICVAVSHTPSTSQDCGYVCEFIGPHPICVSGSPDTACKLESDWLCRETPCADGLGAENCTRPALINHLVANALPRLDGAGVSVSFAKQLDAPLSLVSGTFDAQRVFVAGDLINLAARPIASYTLAWAVVDRSGSHRIEVSPAVKVSADRSRAETFAAHPPPVNASLLRPGSPAKAVIFFVKSVEWTDGTRWTADVSSVLRKAGVRPARAVRS